MSDDSDVIALHVAHDSVTIQNPGMPVKMIYTRLLATTTRCWRRRSHKSYIVDENHSREKLSSRFGFSEYSVQYRNCLLGEINPGRGTFQR